VAAADEILSPNDLCVAADASPRAAAAVAGASEGLFLS